MSDKAKAAVESMAFRAAANGQLYTLRTLWGRKFADKVLEEAQARSPEARWEFIAAVAIKRLVEENEELRRRVAQLEGLHP